MTLLCFEARGLREALLAGVLRKTLQWLLKPMLSPRVAIAMQRRWGERLNALSLPPKRVRIEPELLAGVAGEWLRDCAPIRHVGTPLYLHGDACCIGSPRTHRALTTRLARATGMGVMRARPLPLPRCCWRHGST